MSDFHGALQLPATDDTGDPLLDTLAAFLMAALNADLRTLWAAIHPAVVKPHREPLPVCFAFTHEPDEATFSDNQMPALYVWRAGEVRHVDWTQDWSKAISNVSVLWIPPFAQDEHRRIRQPFRNAFAKAMHKNLDRGRNTAWVVAGDPDPKAADYGSLFIRQAKLTQYWLRLVSPHVLKIEREHSKTIDSYDCMIATLEVHEVLSSAYDAFAAITDVHGSITVGGDELAENGVAVAPYQFLAAVTSCSPATGSHLTTTAVTLRGTQFFLDEDGAGLTIATSDGAALTGVVLVDESTITAVMPVHAAGAVGLVATLPNGSTASLSSAFTYT